MQEIVIPFDERVLNEREASKFCGFSTSTLRRRIDGGTGPKILRLSSKRIGFRVRDLKAWLDEQVEEVAS